MVEGTPIRDQLERVGRFSAENRRTVFTVVAVVLVLSMALAGSFVYMSLGMDLYIDEDSQVNQEWQEVQSEDEFDLGNAVFVMIETDHLHDPETIRAIDRLDEQYRETDEFTSVISLADAVRMGNGGEIPETEAGVEQSIERVEMIDPSAAAAVSNLNPEDDTTLIIASYGEVDVPSAYDQYFGFLPGTDEGVVSETVSDKTEETFVPPHMDVTVTGAPVFENAAFGLMLPEMIKLFGAAFAIIFTIVFGVMSSKVERTWKVSLPLGTAMIALLFMMGMMGVVGFKFNAIMLGVLPIALGLGIDFSLQLHTRYIEERTNGRIPVDAAGAAARTTGNTLLLAMATTSIGLGALLVSDVPPTRQLGATAAFGVIAATMLSLTFLVALLVEFDGDSYGDGTVATDGGAPANGDGEHDDNGDEMDVSASIETRAAGSATETAVPEILGDGGEGDPDRGPDPNTAVDNEEDGRLERGISSLATGIAAAPLLVMLLMVGAIGGGAAVYYDVPTTQQMLDYWPDMEERSDLEDLEDTAESVNVMYVVVDGTDSYSPDTFERAVAFEEAIEAHDDINVAMSPASGVQMQTGGEIPDNRDQLHEMVDRQAEDPLMPMGDRFDTPGKFLIQLGVDDIEGEDVRHLIDDVDQEADWYFETERTAVTGKPVVNRNVIENVTGGRDPMTALSFGMALLFLTAALRSARESTLLIVSVAVSAVMLISLMMYILEIPWNPLTVATGSIALGAGITYGIHVHERFKEEMYARGATPAKAMHDAMVKKSRPVIGSGTTTLFGFGVLGISDFPVLANFGFAVALAMTFALVTSFLFLPAAALLLARYTNTYERPVTA